MNTKSYLWSFRFTIGRGWSWKIEREVTKETAKAWLGVFSKDEPEVKFYIGEKAPTIAKKVCEPQNFQARNYYYAMIDRFGTQKRAIVETAKRYNFYKNSVEYSKNFW